MMLNPPKSPFTGCLGIKIYYLTIYVSLVKTRGSLLGFHWYNYTKAINDGIQYV